MLKDFSGFSNDPSSIDFILGNDELDFKVSIQVTGPNSYDETVISNVFSDKKEFTFKVAQGSYTYDIEVTFIDGTIQNLNGTVIVREPKLFNTPKVFNLTASTTENSFFESINYNVSWGKRLNIKVSANTRIRFSEKDPYFVLAPNEIHKFYPVSNFYYSTASGTSNIEVILDNAING